MRLLPTTGTMISPTGGVGVPDPGVGAEVPPPPPQESNNSETATLKGITILATRKNPVHLFNMAKIATGLDQHNLGQSWKPSKLEHPEDSASFNMQVCNHAAHRLQVNSQQDMEAPIPSAVN